MDPEQKIEFEDPLGDEGKADPRASSSPPPPNQDPVDEFFANSRELWRRIRGEVKAACESTKDEVRSARNKFTEESFNSMERVVEDCEDLGDLIDSFAAEELRSISLGAGEKSETYLRMHELKSDAVHGKARSLSGQIAFDANAVQLFAPVMFKEARGSANPFSELNKKLRALEDQVLQSSSNYKDESYSGSYRERISNAGNAVREQIVVCRGVFERSNGKTSGLTSGLG